MEHNKQKQQNTCAQYSCYEPEVCPLWGTDATPCAKRNRCMAWERAKALEKAAFAKKGGLK